MYGKQYVQIQFLGEKFPGEKCVQEGFQGEESLSKTYIKKYVQEWFLGGESMGEYMWVKRICKKSFWVKSFWVESKWVKICVRKLSGRIFG